MRIGTLRCWLWGHNFRGYALKLKPEVQNQIDAGIVVVTIARDYIQEWFQLDHCVRCGIDKPKQ